MPRSSLGNRFVPFLKHPRHPTVAAGGGGGIGKNDPPASEVAANRTIGDAATPTFTSFTGPDPERYTASVARHADWTQKVFGEASPVQPFQHGNQRH